MWESKDEASRIWCASQRRRTRRRFFPLPAYRLQCYQIANIFIATFVLASGNANMHMYTYVFMQTYALMLELQIVTKDLPTKVW